MKQGYQTTEFWLSAVVAVFSLLASAGVLTPDQASAGSQSVTQIVGGVVTIVALIKYVSSRTDLKRSGK